MKKSIVTLLIISTALVYVIVINTLTLVRIGERSCFCLLSESLAAQISSEAKGMEIEQIIDYSLNLTANQLQFSRYNEINRGKANCVGYAQLCSAICTQALIVNGIEGYARPVVGYVESNGINWCKMLKAIAPKTSYKNFVKDHDFVELTTATEVYHFDPCIYDLLGKKCISITEK